MREHFGKDITSQTNNEQNIQYVNPATVHSTRLAGRAVIRVVNRCDDAKENNSLDLSECQLMQVPDAVYHLMRHTTLTTCNLSGNVITKIPPKFAVKFLYITDLNLSRNRMSKLPDELGELTELQRVDISHNCYVTLPAPILRLPKISHINAEKNYIADVDVERIEACPTLQELNLEENPLSRRTHDGLSAITSITVRVSELKEEEWENLEV